MKESGKKIIIVILCASFLFSFFMMFYQQKTKTIGHDAYERVQQMAVSSKKAEPVPESTEPIMPVQIPEATEKVEYGWSPAPIEEEDPYIQYMKSIDLDILRETNPDVLGWILIPGTQINYPLLQGEDNEYYLKRTWDGVQNSMGSIFLETENTPDFTDFNTIIYGHNMNDGSMFAEIKQYGELEFAQQHPYVYICNDTGTFRYEVFASYKAKVDSATYGLSFNQMKTRTNFLSEAANQSTIDLGIEPALADRVLTLSTCTGTGYSSRWVVQARLKMVYAPQ